MPLCHVVRPQYAIIDGQRRVNAVRLHGDIKESPVPHIALHILNQTMRRTPLRRRTAAMEQAVNPMNREQDNCSNTMSVSWPRSIARSWSSERPLPNIATMPDSMSTLTDVRLILEHLARNRRSRAGQPGSDKELPVKSRFGKFLPARGRKLPKIPFHGSFTSREQTPALQLTSG
jgi:hypothetical protein